MRTDFPDHSLSLVDANSDAQFGHILPAPSLIQDREFRPHRQSCIHRPASILCQFRFLGIISEAAPNRHHGVSDEFVDSALTLENDRHHPLEIFVQLGHHFLGGQLLAHAGIAADIGKEHHNTTGCSLPD